MPDGYLRRPPSEGERGRRAAFDADPGRRAFHDRLARATPSEIDAYVDAEAATPAGLRALLKLLLGVVAADRR